MKKKQSISEITEQIMSVWRKEGLDPRDVDTSFYNLQNDPITKLLIGAIMHQTNLLSEVIVEFLDDLLEAYVESSTPAHLLQPIPAVGMLQTSKRHSDGRVNETPTIIDTDTEFLISEGKSGKKEVFRFLPLLKVSIYDLPVLSVTNEGKGRWHAVLEDREGLSNLNGFAMYIPRSQRCKKIRLSSGGLAISTCDFDEIENLPFVEPFLSGIRYSKNTFQLATVQTLFDLACCHANTYCIINEDTNDNRIYRSNGCIELDIELIGESDEFELIKEDILINCFPVFNAELHRITLSQSHPLLRLDLKGSQFMTIAPALSDMDISDSVIIRSVGTERISLGQWRIRMKRLIDFYESEYNVLHTVLDEKILSAMHQFMAGIRDILDNEPKGGDAFYLVLKDRVLPSTDVLWLTTRGEEANGLGEDYTINISTAELDVNNTRLVTSTTGGHNAVTNREKRHRILQYHMQSKDRIVSRLDIIAFCRYKLTEFFNIPEGDIEDIRIRPDVTIMPDGIYERVIVADISLKKSRIETEDIAMVMERMIKSRTTGISTIRVAIRTRN